MRPKQIQDLARAAYAQAWTDVQRAFPSHEFNITPMEFEGRGATAGRCTYGKRITINRGLLMSEGSREHLIDDTIPHEVGHEAAYQLYGRAGMGHGHHWLETCHGAFGRYLNQYHSIDMAANSEHYHAYECAACNRKHELSTVKHNRLREDPIQYLCKCHGKLVCTENPND